MTQTKLIILAVAGVVLVFWLIRNFNWKPKSLALPDSDKFQEIWKSWWTDGRLVPILACFTLIHISIYKLAPNFWVSQAWGKEWSRCAWFWGIQVAIGIAIGIQKADPSKPIKYKLSTAATILLILTFITHLGGWDIEGKAKGLLENDQTPATTAVGVNLERTPCLEAEKGGDSEKIREALKDYPDLLAVACRESGLNHMDPKDPGEVLVGEDDSRDTGFLQINTHFHPAEVMKGAVGCGDPKDFDCQVKYVKYLHDTSGLESWFPYGPNESGRQYKPLTVLLVASKEYGSRIHIPRITNEYRFDHDKPVVVEAEDYDGKKNEYTLKPKEYTPVPGFNKWMRFKSVDGSPVTVKITYKFQQVP